MKKILFLFLLGAILALSGCLDRGNYTSSQEIEGFECWQIADSRPSTSWATASVPASVTFDLEQKKIINQISINCKNPAKVVTIFDLQASNDLENWNRLCYEKRSRSPIKTENIFHNSRSYQYYKFTVYETSGNIGVDIAEIELSRR